MQTSWRPKQRFTFREDLICGDSHLPYLWPFDSHLPTNAQGQAKKEYHKKVIDAEQLNTEYEICGPIGEPLGKL